MKKTLIVTIFLTFSLSVPVYAYLTAGNKMDQIIFDLGENIHEVAKKSGAPKFNTSNVAGLVSYGLTDVPDGIYFSFVRPGYEVRIPKVFSSTLYADEEHGAALNVETATFMISKRATATHESAQAYVESVIEQFQRGKWKRQLDPLCPAVTGRSSYLNEHGQIDQLAACPLDPGYKISAEDWRVLMHNPQNYEWIGDGILARLSIGYMEGSLGLQYMIDLDFDILEVKRARDEKNLARELQEGDANGWDSTAKMKKDVEALKKRVKMWEESTRQRGDAVIAR